MWGEGIKEGYVGMMKNVLAKNYNFYIFQLIVVLKDYPITVTIVMPN